MFSGNALEKAGGREFLDAVKELRKAQAPLEVASGSQLTFLPFSSLSLSLSQEPEIYVDFDTFIDVQKWIEVTLFCFFIIPFSLNACLKAIQVRMSLSSSSGSEPSQWDGSALHHPLQCASVGYGQVRGPAGEDGEELPYSSGGQKAQVCGLPFTPRWKVRACCEHVHTVQIIHRVFSFKPENVALWLG